MLRPSLNTGNWPWAVADAVLRNKTGQQALSGNQVPPLRAKSQLPRGTTLSSATASSVDKSP